MADDNQSFYFSAAGFSNRTYNLHACGPTAVHAGDPDGRASLPTRPSACNRKGAAAGCVRCERRNVGLHRQLHGQDAGQELQRSVDMREQRACFWPTVAVGLTLALVIATPAWPCRALVLGAVCAEHLLHGLTLMYSRFVNYSAQEPGDFKVVGGLSIRAPASQAARPIRLTTSRLPIRTPRTKGAAAKGTRPGAAPSQSSPCCLPRRRACPLQPPRGAAAALAPACAYSSVNCTPLSCALRVALNIPRRYRNPNQSLSCTSCHTASQTYSRCARSPPTYF